MCTPFKVFYILVLIYILSIYSLKWTLITIVTYDYLKIKYYMSVVLSQTVYFKMAINK